MCELFAISSSIPTNVTFSLDEFSKHGGQTGPHKDGWGIAFYANKEAQIIKEPTSASNSECINFIKSHEFRSKIVISHIRQATQGEVSLENTQPFSRELGGCMHVFAHNGDLIGINADKNLQRSIAHPLGNTDSEYAFCALLNLLKEVWSLHYHPSTEDRIEIISYFASLIRPFGPANFIYSDGELLFAHGHKRKQENKEGFYPPGLHLLQRVCPIGDANKQNIAGIDIETVYEEQKVVLIASVPLTTENWMPLSEGEIVVLKNGEKIFSVNPN